MNLRLPLLVAVLILVLPSLARADALTSVPNTAAGAGQLAAAMTDATTPIGTATFAAAPPATAASSAIGGPAGFGSSFPSQGRPSFAVMSTGKARSVEPKNGLASWVDPGNRGSDLGSTVTDQPRGAVSANDGTVLRVPVTVPKTANCLTFDFALYSGEYEQWVGSTYNDAFVAELDDSDWNLQKATENGKAVTRVAGTQNFAFDTAGKAISVNTTSFSAENAAGTGFAAYGATPLLSASKRVTPGSHTLMLSLFDAGDHGWDSAVLLDALRAGFVPDPAVNCKPGAQPVLYSVALTGSGTDYVDAQRTFTATVQDSTGAPVKQGKVVFTVDGANGPRHVEALTDDDGVATLRYAGKLAGDDAIAACYDNDEDANCEGTASTTFTWHARPTLTVGSADVAEGAGSVDLPVSLDKPATADVTVHYATAGDSATTAEDFTQTTGTLTIKQGQTSGVIRVPIVDDDLVEGDESFTLGLDDPSVAVLGSPADATVTIADDDVPSFSIADGAGSEHDGKATVTITSSLTSSHDMVVPYKTADGTAVAGDDYTATDGTATIKAGDVSTTVDVALVDDDLVEGDEAFSVDLVRPASARLRAAGPAGSATVTIVDDDLSTLSIAPATAGEKDGKAALTVSSSLRSVHDLTVHYATSDGSATAGADYTSVGGTLTVPAGRTSATIEVPVLDDDLVEGDETFGVALSEPSAGATLADDAAADATISDDETAHLSAGDVAVQERAGTATLTVTSSLRATAPITLRYSTRSGSATSGEDFGATDGTLSIPAGSRTATITVPIADDGAVEPDETFTVALDRPSKGAQVDTAGPTVTILNDDQAAPQSAVLDQSESGAAVLCGRDIVLLDVAAAGRKVHVAGLAAARHAGKTVTVKAGGKAVGTTKVAADGTFAADVRRPAKGKRSSIRYSASVLDATSRALKLERRLVITTRSGLTVRGRIDATGRRMPKTVTFYRQLTCTMRKQFATAKVSKHGTFEVTLAKPAADELYALFRITAKVGAGRTFTLPIAIR